MTLLVHGERLRRVGQHARLLREPRLPGAVPEDDRAEIEVMQGEGPVRVVR